MGPPGLRLSRADLTFEQDFGTLSRSGALDPGSAVWHSRFWNGGSDGQYGARNWIGTASFIDTDGGYTLTPGPDPFGATTSGSLVITSTNYTGSAPANYYGPGVKTTSGMLTTLKSFRQFYGYFEFVLQGAAGAGALAAFGLKSYQDFANQSAQDGWELVPFLIAGSAPTVLQSWLRTLGSGKSPSSNPSNDTVQTKTSASAGVNVCTAFTKIGFDWDASGVTRYVNDVKIDGTPLNPGPTAITTPGYIIMALDSDTTGGYVTGNGYLASGQPKSITVRRVRAFKRPATTVIQGTAALRTM